MRQESDIWISCNWWCWF